MQRAVLFLLLTLGGCASYAPAPLGVGEVTLGQPDIVALSRDAGTTGRHYLAPVRIDLSRPLDGNGIATLAVFANPDLRAARARAGISEAQAFSAGLLPDPTLSLGAAPVLAGSDTLTELVAGLGFDLNALRTRGVRVAQAEGARRQARQDLAWSEWQTAGQARIQAVRIRSLETALRFADAGWTSARSSLARYARAAGRGDITADQLQTARTGAADAEDKLRVAERDLAAARLELVRLMGLPPGTPLSIADEPEADLLLDASRLFATAWTSRSDIKALQAGYASQEAAVHQAVLAQSLISR